MTPGPSDSVQPRVAGWVKTEAAGPLRPVGGGPLADLSRLGRLPPDAWAWIDVTAPTVDLALELGDRFSLPDHIVEDALDPEIFPKWEDHDDTVLAVIHLPNNTTVQVDTMPVVCVVGPGLLLTMHPFPNSGLDWFLDAAAGHPALAEGGPDQMLGRLLDFAAREFAPMVDDCETAFDALSDRALQGDPNVLPDTQALRRDAAVLRRILGPQREVVLSLAGAASPVLDEDSRRRLRDAYDRHHRLVEEIDSARVMLASVADTYRAAVAERANDVMKVLTVFSAMLLPLTVIVGIYGMNFENMPELGKRYGYYIVLSVMATIVVGLWIYFVRRGFIGGPKVSGKVGRGLAGVARAPARSVGALVLRAGSSPAGTVSRPQADLDRATLEVLADLFRLGWHAPRTILGSDTPATAPEPVTLDTERSN